MLLVRISSSNFFLDFVLNSGNSELWTEKTLKLLSKIFKHLKSVTTFHCWEEALAQSQCRAPTSRSSSRRESFCSPSGRVWKLAACTHIGTVPLWWEKSWRGARKKSCSWMQQQPSGNCCWQSGPKVRSREKENRMDFWVLTDFSRLLR